MLRFLSVPFISRRLQRQLRCRYLSRLLTRRRSRLISRYALVGSYAFCRRLQRQLRCRYLSRLSVGSYAALYIEVKRQARIIRQIHIIIFRSIHTYFISIIHPNCTWNWYYSHLRIRSNTNSFCKYSITCSPRHSPRYSIISINSCISS